MLFFLRQTPILVNLGIMAVIWAVCAFNYYMLGMLSLTFDNAVKTTMLGYVTDVVANLVIIPILGFMGVKLTFVLCFLFASGCGTGILLWGLDNETTVGFLLLYLGARFGTTAAFTVNYAVMTRLFPVLFLATAFGICNFGSRIFQGLSFLMATFDEPLPMVIFTATSAVSLVSAFFLITPDRPKQ